MIPVTTECECLARLFRVCLSRLRFFRARLTLALALLWLALAAASQAQSGVLDWQPATDVYAGRSGHACLAFQGKLWVIGGGAYYRDSYSYSLIPRNDIWVSGDGRSWRLVTAKPPFAQLARFGAVVFKDRMWVIGGMVQDQHSHTQYSDYDHTEIASDVWSSADGVNWTQVTAAAPFGNVVDRACTVFKDRIWLVTGRSVWSSIDGSTWKQVTQSADYPTHIDQSLVAFDNKLWLIGCNQTITNQLIQDVWCSSDGLSWRLATGAAPFPGRQWPLCLVHNNRLWVISGLKSATLSYFDHLEADAIGDAWWSADGVNWTQTTDAVPFRPRALAAGVSFNGQLYVTGGQSGYHHYTSSYKYELFNDTWRTTDGTGWTKMTDNGLWDRRKGQAVAVFKDQLWLTGGESLNDFSSNSPVMIYYTHHRDVWHSSDGINWMPATPAAAFPGRGGHACIAFNDSLWVIGGQSINPGYDIKTKSMFNDVWRSTDGTSWGQVLAHAPFSPRSGHLCLVHEGKLWLIGGNNTSDVWSTSDGTSWTQITASAPFGKRDGHAGAVLDGRMWVIGGTSDGVPKNDAWWSVDGANWTQATPDATFTPRALAAAVAWQNKLWLFGGRLSKNRVDEFSGSQEVWCSSDGANWTLVNDHAAFGPRSSASAVVLGDRLWLLSGGNDKSNSDYEMSDAWWSRDGANWTRADSTTNCPARDGEAVATFNGRLWITGGYLHDAYYYGELRQDVWSSGDGQHWTQATATAAFPGRQGHGSVGFAGRLWVIGGYQVDPNGSDSSVITNDVWASADGTSWTQVAAHAVFSPRAGFITLAHAGKIWVIGGNNGNGVWSSADGAQWGWVGNTPYYPVLGGFVQDGRMWVTCQNNGVNSLWCSVDGVRWTQPNGPLPTDSAMACNSVAWGGRVWTMDAAQNAYSGTTDGQSWTLQNPPRFGTEYPTPFLGSSTLFNNRLWLLGNNDMQKVSPAWYADAPRNGMRAGWTAYE